MCNLRAVLKLNMPTLIQLRLSTFAWLFQKYLLF